jgi:hypothetical protein
MSSYRPPSLDDDQPLDGPDEFTDAAEAFVGRHQGPLTARHVAQILSWLAQCGYLVSSAEHERACNWYAARLQQAQTAADDPVARLYRDVARRAQLPTTRAARLARVT